MCIGRIAEKTKERYAEERRRKCGRVLLSVEGY